MKKYLVFIIILLLVGVNVSGDIDTKETKETSTTSFDGNILYVGGSGPNNYTTIRGAIKDAVDGDTIFVYNGTYGECNVINKSINLFGEDKNTTIIDGGGGTNSKDIICIQDADGVIISGFTIQNGGMNGIGIEINSDYNTINNNIIGNVGSFRGSIILDGEYNIVSNNTFLSGGNIVFSSSHNTLIDNIMDLEGSSIDMLSPYNNILRNNIQYAFMAIFNDYHGSIISENHISNCTHGIFSWGNDNIITDNIITSNEIHGIEIDGGVNTIISGNIITYNGYDGIKMGRIEGGTGDMIITGNTITNNDIGIEIYSKQNNVISENNIYDNNVDATFRIRFYEIFIGRNVWDANYWGSNESEPVPIKGRIGVIFRLIPWFPQYDYNPASEPYDIEVL